MVKPKEVVSQRELVYRYRILLDEAMRTPPDRRRTARKGLANGKILQLVKENPASTASKHVMWNIGRARREWLLAFLKQEYPEWSTRSAAKMNDSDSKPGLSDPVTPTSTL